MKRTHWFTSPDPPKFGDDLVAVCGKVVPKAQPVKALWVGDDDCLVKCEDCKDLRNPQFFRKYWAAIESGEESISR